jgi:Rhodopirellula transposase DDE domain
VLETRTAGNPDDVTIVFTDLAPARLSATMTKMGTPVCADVIRRWMEEQDLRLRKIAKDLAGGHSPDRDTQFLIVAPKICLSLRDPYKLRLTRYQASARACRSSSL